MNSFDANSQLLIDSKPTEPDTLGNQPADTSAPAPEQPVVVEPPQVVPPEPALVPHQVQTAPAPTPAELKSKEIEKLQIEIDQLHQQVDHLHNELEHQKELNNRPVKVTPPPEKPEKKINTFLAKKKTLVITVIVLVVVAIAVTLFLTKRSAPKHKPEVDEHEDEFTE